MKQIDATFNLVFTTDSEQSLDSANKMKNDILEIFECALDDYLFKQNINSNEPHLITCDDFYIDDYED